MCRLERFLLTSTARKFVMQSRCHSAFRSRSSRRSRRAFTLLELLIVLAIIGVIAAMVVPKFINSQQQANLKLSRTSIMNAEKALELYAVEHDGEFPPGNQEALNLLLKPLDKEGKSMKPFIDKLPKDAWDQPIFYEYPNTKDQDASAPAIWSSGPNRQNENGEGDDINNWKDLAK